MRIDDEHHIGWLVADVARLMRTVFDRRARALGLTRSQWLALTRLDRRPGASQSDLAEMLEIEKASAGRLIDRLEANGWVERRDDPMDRRVNRIFLTGQAERILSEIWPISQALVADATSGLSSAEHRQLADLLSRTKGTLLQLVEAGASEGVAAEDETAAKQSLNGVEALP